MRGRIDDLLDKHMISKVEYTKLFKGLFNRARDLSDYLECRDLGIARAAFEDEIKFYREFLGFTDMHELLMKYNGLSKI